MYAQSFKILHQARALIHFYFC